MNVKEILPGVHYAAAARYSPRGGPSGSIFRVAVGQVLYVPASAGEKRGHDVVRCFRMTESGSSAFLAAATGEKRCENCDSDGEVRSTLGRGYTPCPTCGGRRYLDAPMVPIERTFRPQQIVGIWTEYAAARQDDIAKRQRQQEEAKARQIKWNRVARRLVEVVYEIGGMPLVEELGLLPDTDGDYRLPTAIRITPKLLFRLMRLEVPLELYQLLGEEPASASNGNGDGDPLPISLEITKRPVIIKRELL